MNRYRHLADVMREAGFSEKYIEEAIAANRAEDAALEAGTCPKCGKPIERKLDPRQAGETDVSGQWFNYRCTCCNYMMDRVEGAN